MKEHSKYSPSGAHRWINCSGSLYLEQLFEEEVKDFTKEGQQAHEIAEKFLVSGVLDTTDIEMERYIKEYKTYVQDILKTTPDKLYLVEQRVDMTEFFRAECFGKCDVIIASPKKLDIIDFKYGMGVKVDAHENPQLILYAFGAYLLTEIYDFSFETIKMHIYQPRMGNISTYEMTIAELLNWVNILRTKIAVVEEGYYTFIPGAWCQFCKARVLCLTRAQEITSSYMAGYNKSESPLLLNETQLVEILKIKKVVEKWLKDVYNYSLSLALKGNLKGYKAVIGRQLRKWNDAQAATKLIEDTFGDKADDYFTKEIISCSKLERAIGKKQFRELFEDQVTRTLGNPTLVEINDSRAAIKDTAENDFKEFKEE